MSEHFLDKNESEDELHVDMVIESGNTATNEKYVFSDYENLSDIDVDLDNI